MLEWENSIWILFGIEVPAWMVILFCAVVTFLILWYVFIGIMIYRSRRQTHKMEFGGLDTLLYKGVKTE